MLTEVSRDDFLNELWDWRPGEHAVIVSPTGGGKSWLMWQLLEQSMAHHPQVRPVTMMPKPSDATTTEWSAKLGLRETPEWPPRPKLFRAKPPGYVLWPPHPRNLDADQRHEAVGAELRRGMDSQFWTPNTLTLVDDAHSAGTMYGLNGPIEEHLVNGRSNRSAIWLASQKPSGTLVSGGITSYAWSSASHLFIGKSPADADIKKYGEIAGIDPRLVENTVRDLRTYSVGGENITEWLYVSKRGPHACLVGP